MRIYLHKCTSKFTALLWGSRHCFELTNWFKMTNFFRRTKVAAAFAAAFLTAPASSNDNLVVLYGNLEAYIRADGASVTGFLGEHLKNVFAESGHSVRWTKLEFQRQLEVMKRGMPDVCAVGYAMTADRKSFLKYTPPIGYSIQAVILAKKGREDIRAKQTLNDLFADKSLKTMVTTNRAYGDYTRRKIEEYNVPKAPISINRSISLLQDGTLDYVIEMEAVSAELIELMSITDLAMYTHLKDIAGKDYPYHLVCTMNTSDAQVNRISQALHKLGAAKPD